MPSRDLSATTYVASGWTATAVLETSVHGVVVQTSRSAPRSSGGVLAASPFTAARQQPNLTVMAGSDTVW